MAVALTPLQQAYLLGRSTQVPLGGVAMQEFREYRGRLDPAILRDRLTTLVRQHDSLRTRIDTHAIIQSVEAEAGPQLDEIDLRAFSSAEAEARIAALREDYAHQLHDLERGAPWHILLFHLPASEVADADSHVVFARFDALILDGRSIAHLMVALIGTGPLAPSAALPSGSPTAPSATDRAADAAYWTQRLAQVEGPPRLPWRKPLETLKVSRFAREGRTIAKADVATLGKLGAALGLFRNTVLTALILEVLSHWTEDGAPCVGLPVAPAAGDLRNASSFIALAYDGRTLTFADRARTLQAQTLEGLAHLGFSGVDISRLLMSRNPDGLPLPVVITNGLSWETLPQGAPMRLVGGLTQTPQVAMDIRLSLDGDGNLRIDIDHAREAIDSEVVTHLLDALQRAVAALCRAGTLTLEAADIVTRDHYRHNGVEADFACSGFLARIADNLFGGTRTRDAIVSGARHISYPELGRDVARIIGGLGARGLEAGRVVAICLPRGPEHIMLAVSCALLGLVWVPVDAAAPADRKRFLLDNCHPDLVVSPEPVEGYPSATPAELLASEPCADIPALAQALDARARSTQPAYYLYTSGTTGKPKCVVLSNKATSNVIGRTLERWAVTDADVFISVTPLHHDMSVFDVFGALTAGATLVVPAAGEEKDAIGWNRLVAQHGVTLWCSVPAILEMLLACRQGDGLRSLRLVAQGGDYIKPATIAQLRKMAPNLRLVSLGGPTETTIWSIWHEISAEDVDLVPYGRPLPATSYFVLDDTGAHRPPRVVGRIHTTGVNTALGYLVDGVLTQTDFVTITDAAGDSVRAFRTGDQGYYRPDGTLIFASRVNGYVKVRGVRVSLPDIEAELARHPALRQVLVVDYGAERQGEVNIGVLYVSDGAVPASELRSFARRHLPESHVPTRLLQVRELPLSANGKPDRPRARTLLTTPAEPGQDARPDIRQTVAPPAPGSSRERIAAIYRAVIGPTQPASNGADFLSMGLRPSHLKAIAARLNAEFGVELSPARLVPCRDAGQVAQLIPEGV